MPADEKPGNVQDESKPTTGSFPLRPAGEVVVTHLDSPPPFLRVRSARPGKYLHQNNPTSDVARGLRMASRFPIPETSRPSVHRTRIAAKTVRDSCAIPGFISGGLGIAYGIWYMEHLL